MKHQKTLEAERLRRERESRKSRGWPRSRVLGMGVLVLIALVIGVYAAWQSTQPSQTSEVSPPYTLTDAEFSQFGGKVADCFVRARRHAIDVETGVLRLEAHPVPILQVYV